MFGTIRRHQTWLWACIITITIVSFVFLGPTNTKLGSLFGGAQENFGSIDGRAITRFQLQTAERDVAFEYLIRNEQMPDLNSAGAQKDAYLKLFLVQKAKDAGINISTKAVAARIHQVLGEVTVDMVEDKILKPNGMDLSDLDRYYRDQLAIEQLVMTEGLSGKLATPQEAETMYRLENQNLDTLIVYFSATNYEAMVPVTKEGLLQFYTNQMANYRVPEEVSVDYVKFSASNYLAAAKTSLTNLEQIVTANVEHMGTNLYHDTKTPEESKNAVRKDILTKYALRTARTAASDFANTLDQKIPHSLANLKALAATNGLTVQTTAPFERVYGPQEFIAPPGFAARAFELDTNDLFAGPIIGDDAVYVIGLRQRLPSELPAFTKIEAKVTSDYRYQFALKLARQAAIDFNQKLTNGLAAGKSFNSLCSESGYRAKSLAPFSVSTRTMPDDLDEKVDVAMFKQIAFTTPPGKSGPPAGTRDGAFILYVEKQLPFDVAAMKKALPDFLNYLRSSRQNEAFNQWFNLQIRQDPGFLEVIQRVTQSGQPKGASARRPKS